MKLPSIKFMLRFSALIFCIILPYGLVLSCGPILMPDETRFALFNQGLDGKSGLRPFNYSETLFNFTEADPEKEDYKRNCAEWVSFCGSGVRAEDVYDIQYKVSADSFLVAYEQKTLPQFKHNSFIKWLLQKSNYAAMEYMVLAKQAENTQVKNDGNPWDTSAVLAGSQCNAIALKASNALDVAIPVFLKERYAFQEIKMCYYSSDSKEYGIKKLHQLYEMYLLKSKSIVAAWALVYYGMTQFNNNTRTAYLLQAFDRTEEKKEFCYQQLSIKQLQAFEKNSADTNLLIISNTLQGLKNKGRVLNFIKAVYQYNPDSKYLPVLVTREINKLENWLWSPEMLYFSENYRPEFEGNNSITSSLKQKLKAKDKLYLNEVTLFIEKIERASKNNAAFMQLALAHLYNMHRQYADAQKILQKNNGSLTPLQQSQWLIEKVIATANTANITLPATQQTLASCINKLIVLNPIFKKQINRITYDNWGYESRYKGNAGLSELYVLLSHCFEKKGDILTAGLLYNSANLTVNNYDGWQRDSSEGYNNIAYFDRYALPGALDSLITFKHKKNKTSFEKLISPKKWASDDHYKDLKGTILFRQKKYTEALAVFESMQQNYWHLNYAYQEFLPLTSVMYTGEMVPSEKIVAEKYRTESKMLIVKDITGLLNAIQVAKTNTEKAGLYYKLGNAYFNTSYNGKAWMMFSYGKSGSENYREDFGNYRWAWFNFYPNNIKYADYYYRCNDAISMYKKALGLATEKEFTAKCLLALSVCDKISHDNAESSQQQRWGLDSKGYTSIYLKKLKTTCGNTKAFEEAAVECPDVKSFLSKL